MTRAEQITANLEAVRGQIDRAARAAGRTAGSVRLVAVSKTKPPEDVAAAMAAGQRDFGENYAQELRDKRPAVEALAGGGARWHFIGPLQSNKVKYLAGKAALLHTVDGPGLLEEISRRLAPEDPPQDCLVQVNVAGEAQKRGLAPDKLGGLLDRFADFPRLRCRGLMLIPPYQDDPLAARPFFQGLRQLRDQQARVPRAQVDMAELSMGMSHDLEVAIAEGATMVRVGTAIFGARSPRE